LRSDNQPLDVRFHRDGAELRFAGSYQARPRTPGRDIDQCFQGAITVSRLAALRASTTVPFERSVLGPIADSRWLHCGQRPA